MMEKHWAFDIDDESKLAFRIITLPHHFRFSITYIYDKGDDMMALVRIDNFPHDGTNRTHIHRWRDSCVEYRDMDIKEAEETIIKIGNFIKERMKNDTY